jgi:hypothetical protein
LLLPVFLVVLLSEYRWLEFLQRPDWELWGARVQEVSQGHRLETALAGAALNRRDILFPDRGGFILANSQIFAATLVVTVCIALLLYRLKAAFYAAWLATACVALFATAMLLAGDKARLVHEREAEVALHALAFSVALYFLGHAIERRSVPRVAGPFYDLAILIFLVSGVQVANAGLKEWLGQDWDLFNEAWNLWIMAYTLPVLLCGWLSERYGTEAQSLRARVFYALVPLFLLLPLNLLFSSRGATLAQLGSSPLRVYEVAYLPACTGLLLLGRLLHVEVFLVAALWAMAVFLFRFTSRHLVDVLQWPLAVGLCGCAFLYLGIRQLHRDGRSARRLLRRTRSAEGGERQAEAPESTRAVTPSPRDQATVTHVPKSP